jgi:sulfur carrier protein ThiS
LLFDERGALRPLVNVYVDGTDARERAWLETPLDERSEVRVVAAVAGG